MLTREEALAVSYHSLAVVREVVLAGCSSCLLGDEVVCTENNRHSALEEQPDFLEFASVAMRMPVAAASPT
jgi:hypothetical protein